MPTDASTPVPLCFGLSPVLLRFPAYRASSGSAPAPTCGTCRVDDRGMPTGRARSTGRARPAAARPRPTTTVSTRCPTVRCSALGGGDRRIDVTFEKGYPGSATVRADGDDVVVHRAYGRAHRRAASRRLPQSQSPGKPILLEILDRSELTDATHGLARLAQPPVRCSSVPAGRDHARRHPHSPATSSRRPSAPRPDGTAR